ncbi:MAG TPA: hypothetical protein VLJ62_23795, partial [Burkholderiaceae bacterium]|nr:hypothetical protein [Burkholderiaceae bacterium]
AATRASRESTTSDSKARSAGVPDRNALDPRMPHETTLPQAKPLRLLRVAADGKGASPTWALPAGEEGDRLLCKVIVDTYGAQLRRDPTRDAEPMFADLVTRLPRKGANDRLDPTLLELIVTRLVDQVTGLTDQQVQQGLDGVCSALFDAVSRTAPAKERTALRDWLYKWIVTTEQLSNFAVAQLYGRFFNTVHRDCADVEEALASVTRHASRVPSALPAEVLFAPIAAYINARAPDETTAQRWLFKAAAQLLADSAATPPTTIARRLHAMCPLIPAPETLAALLIRIADAADSFCAADLYALTLAVAEPIVTGHLDEVIAADPTNAPAHTLSFVRSFAGMQILGAAFEGVDKLAERLAPGQAAQMLKGLIECAAVVPRAIVLTLVARSAACAHYGNRDLALMGQTLMRSALAEAATTPKQVVDFICTTKDLSTCVRAALLGGVARSYDPLNVPGREMTLAQAMQSPAFSSTSSRALLVCHVMLSGELDPTDAAAQRWRADQGIGVPALPAHVDSAAVLSLALTWAQKPTALLQAPGLSMQERRAYLASVCAAQPGQPTAGGTAARSTDGKAFEKPERMG